MTMSCGRLTTSIHNAAESGRRDKVLVMHWEPALMLGSKGCQEGQQASLAKLRMYRTNLAKLLTGVNFSFDML